jgi:hypothetical protein
MISARDIYDMYFLELEMTPTILQDDYNSFVIEQTLSRIKENYLATFGPLLRDQILKYIGRKRTDTGLMEAPSPTDYKGLQDVMQKTYRSDMKRRNDVWNNLAEWVVALSHAESKKAIIFALDRVNNCIHNTGENILTKVGSGLLEALNFCAECKDPRALRGKVSSDLRQLRV